MNSIILLVLSHKDHRILNKFYSSSYSLINDIQSLDSSSFKLDINDSEAEELVDSETMGIGNIIFVDYPSSPFRIDVAAAYMGILRSYDYKTKEITTDHFYELFNNDSIPIQADPSKSAANQPIKNRLVYEWLQQASNGVVFKTPPPHDFEYNEQYDPTISSGEELYYGHRRFVIEGSPNAGEYSRPDGYQMDDSENLNQGGIVSDYLNHAAGYEHIVVTPSLSTSEISRISYGNFLTRTFKPLSYFEEDEGLSDVTFTVGQFADKSLTKSLYVEVNESYPYGIKAEYDDERKYKFFMVCKNGEKYQLYSAPIVSDHDPNNPKRMQAIPEGRLWYATSKKGKISSGKYQHSSKLTGPLYELILEPYNNGSDTIGFCISQAQAAHLYKYFGYVYFQKRPNNDTSYVGCESDSMRTANPDTSFWMTVSEFDTNSYVWPTVSNDGFQWELIEEYDSLYDPDNTMCLWAGFCDFQTIIDRSPTYHTNKVVTKWMNAYFGYDFSIVTIANMSYTKTSGAYTRQIFRSLSSIDIFDYSKYFLYVMVKRDASNKKRNPLKVGLELNQNCYSVLGQKWWIPENVGTTVIFINECFSFVKNISIDNDEDKINALFFYYDRPYPTTTVNRIYLTEDDQIQAVYGSSSTLEDILDIPENVKLPLKVKHIVMSYNEEDNTEAKKRAAELTYASSELAETNDSNIEITVDLYPNDYYRVEDLRIGMVGDIYAERKMYENLLLTSIEIDTSKTYFTLKFGAHRSTVYTMLDPIKVAKKKR